MQKEREISFADVLNDSTVDDVLDNADEILENVEDLLESLSSQLMDSDEGSVSLWLNYLPRDGKIWPFTFTCLKNFIFLCLLRIF